MPNRIIREDILTSEAVDTLDPPSEVFYRRLMSKVDDHGLYDARPAILKSHLYPLRHDRVREADISRWMAACQKAGLIVLYAHDGKPYLQMLKTKWKARSEPKYPIPGSASNCAQLQTIAPLDVVVDVVVDEDVVVGPRKRGKQPKVQMPKDFGVSDRVRKWAAEKGYDRLQERLEHFKGKALANGYAYADWDEAFMGAIRDDWAKLPKAAPSAVPRGKPVESTETPLEKAVNWIRQQCHLSLITETQRDAQIAEAKQKHGG